MGRGIAQKVGNYTLPGMERSLEKEVTRTVKSCLALGGQFKLK